VACSVANNNKLRVQNRNTPHFLMKPDPLAMKILLRRRETELQKLIRQMKHDRLHSSPVYRNLEQELEALKEQLSDGDKKQ
jgi:hypothetical protein